ncbi:MAG: sulfate permease, SulP family [Myxococcales bacterium]|jgi:SulP family sulfate permease|nr:sulfate permease, SulP family [Myxococcales bacterium]
MARTRYHSAVAAIRVRDLPAAALRAVLREGYTRRDLKADVLAGLVVGVVALPLAMALAIGVGVPPQHGLYTAIVAGALVAALGGSRTQVTGPTAAFIVILAPIYTKFGMAGLLISGAMGGLLLIGMGLGRLGQFIEFIPHPVTTGFTAGIATVIATLQIKDVFGLHLTRAPEHFFDRLAALWEARASASLAELAVAASTLALLVYLPRLTRRVPAPLLALPIAAVLAAVLAHFFPAHPVATIASRFHSVVNGHTVDGVPPLPPLPMLPWHAPGPGGGPFVLSFATLRDLLSGAFAVAMLGGIESLLSAVVADGMAGTRHDPDAELLALGIANVVTPFMGGIPATGAIARTATNIRSGGRSPFAAIIHALTVLLAVLVLAPLIGYLPMAGLAGLLLLVAWNMSEVKHFGHIVSVAPGSDVLVLITCFVLTVVFDMVVAVSVGVVLAALLFMRRMADITQARLTDQGTIDHSADGVALAASPGIRSRQVAVYEIAGPLFFGAAQKAVSSLGAVESAVKVLIIRMDRVPVMDATGLVALESSVAQLFRNRCTAILTGLQEQPRRLLEKSQLKPKPFRLLICPDLAAAIATADEIVGTPPTAAAS